MTDLGSAYDRLKKISLAVRPIRITTQIWVVTHFCSRFSDVISRRETSRGVPKGRLFSQAVMAPCLPFYISSEQCRINILIARRYPYSLQAACCYAWHQFKSTLCSRQLRNLLLEQHTTIKTSFRVRFAYMDETSPQSDTLEKTTLEVEGPSVQFNTPYLKLSDQGKCKICKYSQSPFNQFSFSILSLFLRLKTGLNYTRKDVDQKRILNPYFEQLFCRMLPRLPIISFSISMTTMLRFSSSLYIAPTKNEKGQINVRKQVYFNQ